MHSTWTSMKGDINRRTFLNKGLAAAGAATAGVALFATDQPAFADNDHDRSGSLSRGDAALLRFAAAAEILETDFWVQYNELCGVPDSEVPGGTGNPAFTDALSVLDSDMAQYVHDNTDDEFTHQNFLNAYLKSKGADTVDLEAFRTLPGSTATGSSGKLRLTNLMKLTLDTSWWTRYRSSTHNPDLDPNFQFPQAIPTLAVRQHTAIPGPTPTPLTPTSSRPLRTPPDSTCRQSSRAATAFIPPWRSGPAALRSCAFSSASVPLKPCTSKRGPTKQATPCH